MTSRSKTEPDPRNDPSHPTTAPPWSILLAGDTGDCLSRLIPRFHTDERPKQFATFIGTRSMFRHTYYQAPALSAPERTLIILTAGQEDWASAQLPRKEPGKILVQPRDLGTGPAIFLAIAHIMAKDPEASVVVFPTDHFICPEEKFLDFVSRALDACNATLELKVVLLGAEPSVTSGEMSWVVPGKPSNKSEDLSLFEVERFVEKPTDRHASRIMELGALWNTCVMAGRARSFWYLLWHAVPEAAMAMNRFHDQFCGGVNLDTARKIEPFDFSRDVLTQAREHVNLCPLYGVHWRDWRTAESFFETVEEMQWMDRVDEKVFSNEGDTSRLAVSELG